MFVTKKIKENVQCNTHVYIEREKTIEKLI